MWYPAVVTFSDAERGCYVVKFEEDGSVQTDTLPKNVKKVKKSKKRKSVEELVIPEHLKILPTDSDKVKSKKRKKVKALKSKKRFEKLDHERAKKKSNWRDFNKKNTRVRGFYTTTNKGSMFASPDSVDGKVGVTGSGKGLTKEKTADGVLRYKPKVHIHKPESVVMTTTPSGQINPATLTTAQ